MTSEEIRELAKGIASPVYPAPFARDGELAATDGKILLQAWSPSLRHEKGDEELRSGKGPLDWEPKESVHFAGSPAWCLGELREVAEKWLAECEKEAEKDARIRRRQWEDAKARAALKCPCCCGTVYLVDGMLSTEFHEWDFPEKDALDYGPNYPIGIAVEGLPTQTTNPVYLAWALRAAAKLGGCGGLWVGRELFMLSGFADDVRWRISWTGFHGGPVKVVPVKVVGATEDALQDGDGKGGEA